LKIIYNLSGKRLDPAAASAITAIYYRGDIRITRQPAPAPSIPVKSAVPTPTKPATPIAAASEAPA